MAKTLAELRGMPRAQLDRLTKPQLIESILESDDAQLWNKLNTISADIAQIKQDMSSPDSAINKKISSMQTQIDQQAEVIKQQQAFLEAIDRRERETKLVVLGVPDGDEQLDGATSEEEKIRKIWDVMDENVVIKEHRRLGRNDPNSTRKRPILIQLESKDLRDRILRKTRRLKEAGPAYERVFVKKDVHPSVRNEWKRLRDAENAEKNRPENYGHVIRLDVKERKLYRDDVVIDSWKYQSF